MTALLNPYRRTLCASLVVATALAGCRAAAVAPTPAAPTLPTSAAVGGTNIVAIAPPAQQCCPKQTLPEFLGITAALGGIKNLIGRLRNRLGTIWPGLEAKPEILAITDPANLESPNPAVQGAAEVKAEEDAAAQKGKAIAYLATVGCAGCYPGIEEALLAALDDCTEIVRFETVKALRSTTAMPCKNCCRSACCGPKIREKLEKLAYETDEQGCYTEPSDRVRRLARLALANCNCVPVKPGQPADELPQEGPAEQPPLVSPAPAATASVLVPPATAVARSSPGSVTSPVGSGVATNRSAPLAAAPGSASASLEVAWEVWTARPEQFASAADALATATLARTQMIGARAGEYMPPQFHRRAYDWSRPEDAGSAALARAVATTPLGGVSGIVEDSRGWHLVRVLARRPAVIPAAYTAPAAAVTSPGATAAPATASPATAALGSLLPAPAARVAAAPAASWAEMRPARVALPHRAADCNCR